MRITKLKIENFKFFDHLTVEGISKEAEVVLLVGPNGTGKSCIFDAFNYFAYKSKRNGDASDDEYYKKDRNKLIGVHLFDGDGIEMNRPEFENRSVNFYGRSSYRFTSKISRDSISTGVASRVLKDQDAPITYAELDQRIENDIEKALGEFIQAVQAQLGRTDKDIVAQVIGKLNESLRVIFPDSNLSLNRIVDPHSDPSSSKIDLEFSKNGTSFSFRNLSAGEKEVVDIIFNFHRRKDSWIKDGVYFIDEPELHLNTKIQALLFKELHRLCKEMNAQLWVATHSLGFLRAAQDEKRKEKNVVSIIEFKPEFADSRISVRPIDGVRKDWQRIFQTALEDITGLVLPELIIYCEGEKKPSEDSSENGVDANIYNKIFEVTYPEAFFVSSGGGNEPVIYSAVALDVLQKAFVESKILVLKDRGGSASFKTDEERTSILSQDPRKRILLRREIENYLFDPEILKSYKTDVDISSIYGEGFDYKTEFLKPKYQKIKQSLSFDGDIKDLMLALAERITPTTSVYLELAGVIFDN